MDVFTVVEDGAAILFGKGTYRQAKVYRRGKGLYIGVGGGFVKVKPRGATSSPSVRWLEIEWQGHHATEKWGQELEAFD